MKTKTIAIALASTLYLFVSPQLQANDGQPALTLGPFDQGIYDGTAPFSAADTCSLAGHDCDNNDLRVRTNDLVQFAWSVTRNATEADASSLSAVIVEQRLIPGPGADVEFAEIPAVCLPEPAGTGGAMPASEIISETDGSSVLRCNIGLVNPGEQRSFTFAVRPLIGSENASVFSTDQMVYGLTNAGQTVHTFSFDSPESIEISAAPRYDLIGDRVSISRGESVVRDIGSGEEAGFLFHFTSHLAAGSEQRALGMEQLGMSYSFSPGVFARLEDGTTNFDLRYGVTACEENRYDWPNTVYGDESYNPTVSNERKVSQSGDCQVLGNSSDGYTLTVNATDTSGSRFPSETLAGSSLLAGPYFVAAHSIEVFVPLTEIDRADGIPDDNKGGLFIGACLSDFDPVSDSGVSNYLDGFEPGYNGGEMPDGAASNNCANQSLARLTTEGQFSFRAVSFEDDAGTRTQYEPLISGFHAGDGLAEPGQAYGTLLYFNNNSSTNLTNFWACTVFDNSVQHITDRAEIGASAGSYAYEGSSDPAGFDAAQWELQYGVAAVADDDPLDNDADGVFDRDPVSGRYQGTWNRLAGLRCDSPTIQWYSEPTSDNIDSINIVRYRPAFSGGSLNSGQEIRLVTPLRMRDSFYGGPHNGSPIPNGTVAAAFGAYRADELHPGWSRNDYQPAPENSAADGDRMTLARVRAGVEVSTAQPYAEPGVVETVLAGNTVTWQLQPTLNSLAHAGQAIDNIQLIAELSAGSSYEPACSAATASASAPTTLESDMPEPGMTTLIWNLGTVTAATQISPITVCVETERQLLAGTEVLIQARVKADNAVASSVRQQRISLGQAGTISSEVEVKSAFSTPGAPLEYALTWRNYSAVTSLAHPSAINVLPFNGDNDALLARFPGSSFNGEVSLAAEPEATWPDAGTPIAAADIGQFFYTADNPLSINPDPRVNDSHWCIWNGNVFVQQGITTDCPSLWSDVTAIRFDSGSELGTAGTQNAAVTINYTLDAAGSEIGDTFINSFVLGSASLPEEQYIDSRHAAVSVVSFSISGLAYAAIDNNLQFNENIDALAPDGIEVHVLDAQSGEIVQTGNTLDGEYGFQDLVPGEYIISIPADNFDQLGSFPGWTAAAVDATGRNITDPDSDFTTSGLRSLPITIEPATTLTLDATAPRVDLVLLPSDADGDGIPDIEELGGAAFTIGGIDTDGDGIANHIDQDSDGDGISDADEGNRDTDGDGVPDYIDTDSDGDGILDSVEGTGDEDGDGIPDYIDATDDRDTDGDTIPDVIEGDSDVDGDGLPNSQDTDSDGDGIPDQVEKNTDTDGDGLANYIDTDSDQDTIPDYIEGTDDINENGVPDYIDNTTDPDVDGDGIANFIEGIIDTDGDGIENQHDTDSDADGIADHIETVADSDGDGLPNYVDLDSDGDGIPDSQESAADPDGDGLGNFIDLDSDNDGMFDLTENGARDRNTDGRLDNEIDNDLDGIDDPSFAEQRSPTDTDSDNVPDFMDVDSDNDNITDLIELHGETTDLDRDGRVDQLVDLDLNGASDSFPETDVFPRDVDRDRDGAINSRDLDSDGDERSDLTESGGTDRDGDFIVDPMIDSDSDGIQDNADVDATGGNDYDADGIDDLADRDYVAGGDTDGDGIADSMDVDADGDGKADPTYFDPQLGLEEYPDIDNNDVPDFLQPISGILESGVGGEGVGCSISHSGSRDPMLPSLVVISLLWLMRRARTAASCKKAER